MVAASPLPVLAEAVGAVIAFGRGACGRAVSLFRSVHTFAIDVDVEFGAAGPGLLC